MKACVTNDERKKYPLLNQRCYSGLLKCIRRSGTRGVELVDWLWSGPAARELEELGLVHGLIDYDSKTDTIRRLWVATEYLRG